jgi:hypothetical protein
MPDSVKANDGKAMAAGICIGECHALDDGGLARLLSTNGGTKSGLVID